MANMAFIDSGLPTKIFEYQSYGKPILCVSNGEAARYIELTQSGIVVPLEDSEALHKAIIDLCTDKRNNTI